MAKVSKRHSETQQGKDLRTNREEGRHPGTLRLKEDLLWPSLSTLAFYFQRPSGKGRILLLAFNPSIQEAEAGRSL